MFLHLSVSHSVHRGVCMAEVFVAGRGHVWQGGHAWQGACMAGDMRGRGHVCQRGIHGRGACMAEGVCVVGHAWSGACVVVAGCCRGAHVAGGMPAGETATEAGVLILLECILVMKYHYSWYLMIFCFA